MEARSENPFDQMKDTLREGVKVVVADQLFPTPPDLARRMVEEAEIEENYRVLEPSAGTGNILKAIGNGPYKVAVEINPALVNLLGFHTPMSRLHVIEADFLACNGDLGTFDRILMNPPFKNGEDIKHIHHAMTFLKPGGRLVAICANGPRQNERLKPLASVWEELPADTFKDEGTGVNVALMVFNAPESEGKDIFGEW
jgi:phospholipid N-methyltransferase